jgi:hypothetical protein
MYICVIISINLENENDKQRGFLSLQYTEDIYIIYTYIYNIRLLQHQRYDRHYSIASSSLFPSTQRCLARGVRSLCACAGVLHGCRECDDELCT